MLLAYDLVDEKESLASVKAGAHASRPVCCLMRPLDEPNLVLDEPREGLDTVTEQALPQSVMTLMSGLILPRFHVQQIMQRSSWPRNRREWRNR